MVRQHRFGATRTPLRFFPATVIEARDGISDKNIHQLELRFGFIFRPVVDQRMQSLDIAGL